MVDRLMPVHDLTTPAGDSEARAFVSSLRLDPRAFLDPSSPLARGREIARGVIADVAARGDDALVELAKRHDDPHFTLDSLRVSGDEIASAASRVSAELMAALRRSIAQVREYQQHIMPPATPLMHRGTLELGLRFTPIDRVGLYIPGGTASYPSTVIMLAVPAQVAGVRELIVCVPPSAFGRSDLVLAVCHELGIENVFRIGGPAAIAAMGLGTQTIKAVDKIVGPGNTLVQLAKRELAGCVGIDGFSGPSEIVTLADESADAAIVAADLLAQAEHDPGRCVLLCTSQAIASDVVQQIEKQLAVLPRREAIARALASESATFVHDSIDVLIDLANELAAEHVSVQVRDVDAVMARLRHAGCVFIGRNSPVAAGDYVAGPSHCLPTNTTARFSGGISVYEFLKRTSLARYDAASLEADASAIIALAQAEHLDAHARSVEIRAHPDA